MTDQIDILEELQRLGITPQYKGYRQMGMAVQLALEDEDRLTNVMTDIYWTVADSMGYSRTAIERNIRTICRRAWNVGRARLLEIACYELSAPPSASEFISILTTHIHRMELQKEAK